MVLLEIRDFYGDLQLQLQLRLQYANFAYNRTMDTIVEIVALMVTILGFAYVLIFGQVTIKEALPHGIRHMFQRPQKWELIATFQNRVTSVSFSKDGKKIAAGGFDNQIHLIDYPGKKTIHFSVHMQTVRQIIFGPVTFRIYSCSDDGYVLAIDPQTHRIHIIAKSDVPIFSFIISGDETRLYSSDKNGRISAWSILTAPTVALGSPISTYKPKPESTTDYPTGACFSLCFGKDEASFFAAGAGGKVIKVSCGDFGQTAIGDLQDTVFSLAYNQIGKTLFAACSDGNVRCINTTSKRSIILHGHSDSVRWLVFKSPHTLISSSKDRTIRIWSLDTGTHLILEGHKDYVYQISLHGNGDIIASACGNGDVYVWNTKES